MLNRSLIFIILVIISVSSFGQSNLVLYDADGYRIGTVLGYSPNFTSLSTYTSDGYLLSTHPRGGLISNYAPIYYATADCSGQAYVAHEGGTAYEYQNRWTSRGGEIFRVSDGNSLSSVHARSDWVPTRFTSEEIFTSGECWRWDACGQPAIDCREESPDYGLFYPATVIDNAQYGIKDLGNGGYGYRPPMIPRVEKPNVISCNGFEGCPAD